MALFVEAHGMRELAYLVPLRLTNDQPVLIKATLYAAIQNIRCNYPELAREYLKTALPVFRRKQAHICTAMRNQWKTRITSSPWTACWKKSKDSRKGWQKTRP